MKEFLEALKFVAVASVLSVVVIVLVHGGCMKQQGPKAPTWGYLLEGETK